MKFKDMPYERIDFAKAKAELYIAKKDQRRETEREFKVKNLY